MSTKRTRVTRNLIPEISDEVLAYLSDNLLGAELEKPSLDLFLLRGDDKATKSLWEEHKAAIMAAWIRERPGTRPSQWWRWDAPRISQESIASLGRGATVAQLHQNDFCEPRKRLGGTGTPNYEVLNYWPHLDKGIPDSWVSADDASYYNGRSRDIHGNPVGIEYKEGRFTGRAIDSRDPPTFESEAQYLKRHGLFAPGEERRLPKDAFEPEVVQFAPEEQADTTADRPAIIQ